MRTASYLLKSRASSIVVHVTEIRRLSLFSIISAFLAGRGLTTNILVGLSRECQTIRIAMSAIAIPMHVNTVFLIRDIVFLLVINSLSDRMLFVQRYR